MKNLIKVRIDKSTKDAWYSTQIGSELFVTERDKEWYILQENYNCESINCILKCILKSDCTVLTDGEKEEPIIEPVIIAKAGEEVRIVDYGHAFIAHQGDNIVKLIEDLTEDTFIFEDQNGERRGWTGNFKNMGMTIEKVVEKPVKEPKGITFPHIENPAWEEPIKEESETIHFNWLDFRSGKYDVIEKGTMFPINLDMPMSKFITMVDNLLLIPKTETVWVNRFESKPFKTKESAVFDATFTLFKLIETIEVKRPIK